MFLSIWLSVLANTIIDRDFQNVRCLIVLTDDDGHFEYTGSIPSILVKVAEKGAIKSESQDMIFKHHGCQGIVICSQRPRQIFENFEKQIRSKMDRFNNRRYLIVSVNSTTKSAKEFFDQNPAVNFVKDLVLIVIDKIRSNKVKYGNPNKNQALNNSDNEKFEQNLEVDAQFELWTHKYVGQFIKNQATLIDRWFSTNGSFLRNANLYPDKMKNQEGRELKMATFTYEPYSIVDASTSTMHGSEMQVAVNYAKFHNMTPVPVVNELDYWGDIFPNGSGNGILGNLVNDRADIGFAALYTWEFCYHHLDLSKPVVRTGITCLVPSPKPASGWFTPLLSYQTSMWTSLGLVLLTSVLAMIWNNLVIQKTRISRKNSTTKSLLVRHTTYQTVYDALVKTLKPLLQQALAKSEFSRHKTVKFLTGLQMMLGLFFAMTYSSGLASIMTLPRYKDPINTVKELAQSGLNWGATQDAWIKSIERSTESDYVKIVQKFQAISEEKLRRRSIEGNFGFSIERLPFGNFAIGSYLKRDVIHKFHLMQQDLYWEQCVIMTRKNSVLLPSLDDFILRVSEAGIISRWQNKAVDRYMDPYVQRVVKYYAHHSKDGQVIKLKWTHVQGAFAALILGYSLSFVVFLIEFFRRKFDGFCTVSLEIRRK